MKKYRTPKVADCYYRGLTANAITTATVSASDVLRECKQLLLLADSKEWLNIISCLYSWLVTYLESPSTVPSDFISFAYNAAQHLHSCGRSNIIYLMAKGIGTMRPDNSDSLLPAKRMPMGLIEYTANFFASDNVQQVSIVSYS